MSRRPTATTLAALLALATVPGIAAGHAVSGDRFEAPVPLSLLLVGAGVTVALTALLVAARRESGPAESAEPRRLATLPADVVDAGRAAASAVFLVAFAAALYAGLSGEQTAVGNFATVFAWPLWLRGLALVALLVGSPWPTLSPWRTIYRLLSRLEGRPLGSREYPAWLAAWPAFVGFLLVFGVVENATVVPRSPRDTAVVLAVYALVMVCGAVTFGPTWLRRADPLAVFYRLLGRVAPLRLARTDGGYALTVSTPWAGCRPALEDFSLAAFVVAVVWTLTFDGLAETRAVTSLVAEVGPALGGRMGVLVALYAAGLFAAVGVLLVAAALGERLGGGRQPTAGFVAVAPTVLPIAAAYEVAHNYPLVFRNLGRLPAVAVDGPALTFLGWLSVPGFWWSQVVLLVVGHVVAVVAADAVARRRYGSRALRGHAPLVGVMVLYTMASLWVVSRPIVG